jgi:hypothetical protein
MSQMRRIKPGRRPFLRTVRTKTVEMRQSSILRTKR